MKKRSLIVSLLVTAVIGSSCSQSKKSGAQKNPAGYDLSAPVKYQMPSDLLEISGIAFNRGDNSLIYAEQDEEGKLFYFKPGDKQVSHVKFGKRGDFEDVAILDKTAVILRSDGTLISFPLSEVKSVTITSAKEFSDLLPAGEYEGLHADQSTNKLYALCKQCGGDREQTSGYIFNLAADGTITKAGTFGLDVQKISALTGKKKLKFRPSALAKNPLTKQWYILSSVNQMLVVADERFHVQQAYPLPSGFLQPEGMTFDSRGNLYISNEGDKVSSGNILMFKYTR